MPKEKNARKRRFQAALALAGMTGPQFATKHGVTNGHLWMVIAGTRESAVLTEQVDSFIEKHWKENALAAGPRAG